MSETNEKFFPASERLTFKWRKDQSVERKDAKEVTVLCKFDKLTNEDMLEWAYSAMDVAFQGKLRAKTPPAIALDKDGKPFADHDYEWVVPARGTRTVASAAKAVENLGKVVDQMTLEMKYQLFIKMGTPKDVALQLVRATDPNFKDPNEVPSETK